MIQVVSDVVCPWCFIGKRRLEKALALLGRPDAAVEWKPFELNPDAPREGMDRQSYRIRKFGLAEFVDFFVSSCFVHFRKPDTDIFRMAIDLAQTPPEQTVYLDDRPLFVEVARSMGLKAIHHITYEETKQAFAELGLWNML